jgi:hypothetical protein
MKQTVRNYIPAVLLMCVLVIAGRAQIAMKMTHNALPTAPEAQKIFDKMKSLEGSWLGSLTTTPQAPGMEKALAQIVLRVTSKGHAVLHEITVTGIPDDPITMFYLEGDQLLLTHYCDAGNRPRMRGKISDDGSIIEFDFIDLAGGERKGHMSHVTFKIIDADHHTEDWTLMLVGVDRPVQAHFDLQRGRSKQWQN